jgi:16S rRNA (adenine1518-N6/adenine1519-N6)-dimethyltransferase
MSPPRIPSRETASSSSAKAQLNEHGLRPKRTLGQNFLADEALCTKIAELTLSCAGRSVLEIGAGLGALTAPLLQLGGLVAAVETDPGLVAVLRTKFAAAILSGQLQLIEADARELDFARVLGNLPAPRVFAGNLPYHLSGLLLRRAVDHGGLVQRSVFLLQLEVVGRLCAAPGTEAYGALSVFAQAVYAPRRAFVVRRGAFYPQPTVDSAVVVLEPLEVARATLDEAFSGLVRAAFEKRRKTLRNAWRDIFGLPMPELEQLARSADVDLGVRGETLGVVDFERMAARIRGRGASP